jgi:hypothetical protein
MDSAYGYFELNLFEGAIKLPLKFCTSYPGEDALRANAPTKTGVNGRSTNRVFVLAKKGCDKVESVDDIEQVIKWGEWETYLNTGTTTKPELVPLSKYPGLAELLEQDKARCKERDMTVHGIYPLNKLKVKQYNGRHFHTYPHTAKSKDSEKHHNIYRILALYLKLHEAFVLCTFFSKGEELGALYEEDGVLRIAGLFADSDLKPVGTILKFGITKGFQKLAYQKFDKLLKEEAPALVLEWRDYVNHTMECKGVTSKAPVKKAKVVNEEELDKDLTDMFSKV